ncbi:hypothetical protein WA171_005932 [Blastocystis sp. BT1]
MDDNGKEKRKQALKEKVKEHRQWLEDMKVKQMIISKKLNGKRKEDLRKSVIRKAEKALYSDSFEDIQSNKDEKTKEEKNKNNVSLETKRQRFFAKHLNLTADYPKTASEDRLEKEMDVAISKGDFRKAERLNKELYNIHIAKAVQDASAKASYEMERLKEENKPKPMLDWKFNRKARWERKGNS